MRRSIPGSSKEVSITEEHREKEKKEENKVRTVAKGKIMKSIISHRKDLKVWKEIIGRFYILKDEK